MSFITHQTHPKEGKTMSDHAQRSTFAGENQAPGINFTLLPDRFGSSRRLIRLPSIEQFAHLCLRTKASRKEDLPWAKFGALGSNPSEKGCYRCDANVTALYGCEGDYDGTDVPIEDAVVLIDAADIEAVMSETTTPGHWRIWLPASRPVLGTPDQLRAIRGQWVARANGVLGGVLARESFVLSQAFYFGGIAGHPAPKVFTITEAPRIDLLDRLDEGALYPTGRSEPTPPPEWDEDIPEDLEEVDDDPELTEEGLHRVSAFLRCEAANAKSPTATGTRAWRITNWLADMRTWDKLILSSAGIANLLRNDFPDTDENAVRRMLTTRRKPRGCSEI